VSSGLFGRHGPSPEVPFALVVAFALLCAGAAGIGAHSHQAVAVPLGLASFIGAGTTGRDPERSGVERSGLPTGGASVTAARAPGRVSSAWKDRLGVLAQERVFGPDASPTLAQVRKSAEVGELREQWIEEFKAGISASETAEVLFVRIREREVPTWTNSLLAVTAEEQAARSRENPWRRRKGWETEPELPILPKDDGETPQEPGYVVRNELVAGRYLRPFRTTTGEPRVAFPTKFGIEVRDPSSPEFVDGVGYRFWTLVGKPVPLKNLGIAARALTQRALARELPLERIVDLAIRVAIAERGVSLLDLADRERRCVRISSVGWTVERVGYPVFDSPSHLAELPEPVPSKDPTKGWSRYDQLFQFVNLPERNEEKGDPRLLVAAVHVQFLVASGSPKPVVALIGEEGVGKTTAAERLQEVVDPSKVRSLGTPESPKELADLAYNRAVINLDNLSVVPDWLSDHLARLCTGAGLAKRQLFTDRGEVIARRVPWILFNGITPTPRHADLIRRTAFLELERPKSRLALGDLEREWQAAHPEILGGLLDLASAALRVLRDFPSTGGSGDSMADFVRIGRAVAVAMGREAAEFDRAWAHNLDRQGAAAAENPWVGVLLEQLEKQEAPIAASELAKRISEAHKETWSKGVTPQQVGNEIARCKLTLERLGLVVRTKQVHGISQYSRQISTLGPSGPPLESFTSEKVGGPQGGPRVDLEVRSTLDLGGPPPAGPPRPTPGAEPDSPSENRPQGGPEGPEGPIFKVSASDPTKPLEGSSLEPDGTPLPPEAVSNVRVLFRRATPEPVSWPSARSELARTTGISEAQYDGAIGGLLGSGEIVRVSEGVFRLREAA
jgi:hypothetical protein